MAVDNSALLAWCEEARNILATVRGKDQVSAVSRKDLRHIRSSFETASFHITGLKAISESEARPFEASYSKLLEELKASTGGGVTIAIGERIRKLDEDAIRKAREGFLVKKKLYEQALAATEKRNALLETGLDLSHERNCIPTASQQADSEDFEEANRSIEMVNSGCVKANNEMNVIQTNKKFKPLEKGVQIEEGQWAVKSLMDYQPSGALNIPGTSFDDVCPGQSHVNKSIVEAKIAAGLPGRPIIPAAISPDGKICLLDKHHTFVACMALGRPVQLALTAMPTFGGKPDWGACTWQKFTPKAVAAGGFSLKPEASLKFEGPRVKDEKWKDIVPWRKDGQELDATERPATPDETRDSLLKVQEGSDKLDQKIAEEFRTLLDQALKVGPLQEHFANLVSGDDFKIKFDPAAENAYYEGNTIVLPTTKGKEGEKRSAADILDALVFESCNIEMKDKFKEFDSTFAREGVSLEQYGKDKAGLEASLTVFRSSKMVFQMIEQGCKVADQGLTNIEAIRKLDPTFFDEVVGVKRKKDVDFSEREKELVSKLQALVCDTPHQSDLDPNIPKDLKKPQWLKSGEMYFYEKARDMGPMALNTLLLKRLNAKGVTPADWINKSDFHKWLSDTAALYTKERDKRPLLYCKLLTALKKAFPKFDVSGLEFNSDMIRVAVANGTGVKDLDAPPPIELRKVQESDYEEEERIFNEKLRQLNEALKTFQPTDKVGVNKKIRSEDVARTARMNMEGGIEMPILIRDIEQAIEALA